MTLSSRLIHAGLGLATHTLAYVGTAIVVGIGYALGSLGHARAMKRAAGQRVREVIEPEPQTVEDLIRNSDSDEPVTVIVISDSTERAAANDQRWN